MWPDRVSNPGPLTYESGALPTAQRGPAKGKRSRTKRFDFTHFNFFLSTQLCLSLVVSLTGALEIAGYRF